VLRALPRGAGVILAVNHADQTDFKVCLELSRRAGRRFLFMMNREAFDEGWGVAGWWLQRLGAFSVERGGLHNEEAKRYAIEVVMRGREVLVIFPEGEIHYLNDLVQPFKSGAVDIGLQAVVEAQRTRPGWTAYLVPIALKYHYRQPIRAILERRVRRMEQQLSRRRGVLSLQQRLAGIVAELLHRQEVAHQLKPGTDRLAELSDRVQEVRQAILARIEGDYAGPTVKPKADPMDRAWRLSSYLRDLLTQGGRLGAKIPDKMRNDLAELKRVVQMGSWQPKYLDVDPSEERLAETVLKLEREVYRIKRPHRLANRGVFVRTGEPIDLGPLVPAYLRDGQAVRHRIAEQLRDTIQALINTLAPAPPPTGGAEPGVPEGGPQPPGLGEGRSRFNSPRRHS